MDAQQPVTHICHSLVENVQDGGRLLARLCGCEKQKSQELNTGWSRFRSNVFERTRATSSSRALRVTASSSSVALR